MKLFINSFTKALALAATLALPLSLPAESRAQAADERTGPLKISSRGSAFGVQVEVEGTFYVREHHVEVNIDRAVIYVSDHCPYKGRRVVHTLTLGLATAVTRGSWDIESRGVPLVIERVMRPGDEYTLNGLHFQIPRREAADLSGRWLVVQTEELALDVPEEKRDQKGYAFAHSCRCIFRDPAGP